MAAGFKPIENRSWTIEHEGPMLFHAAKKQDIKLYREVRKKAIELGVDYLEFPEFDALDYGGLVGATAGVMEILEPKDHDDGWHFANCYGHVLGPVARLPFRPMKGYQRFWRVKLSLEERRLLEQAGVLSEARHAFTDCNCDFVVLCEKCRQLVGNCLLSLEQVGVCAECV